MKNLVLIGFIIALIVGCSAQKSNTVVADKSISKKDTIRIANDSLEYEVIIIEPGFESWLATAKPRNYYSLTFLENKNYFFVTEYNRRVLDVHRYNPNLYEMRIDYDPNIHYGLEVNYLLYNYFIYFQNRYKQKL
ncbi:MAG TPA: DUF6146 family protein [Flavobacterium sp.]|nr:DUF6146 family protein [Flavobacterium sp.]